MFTRKKFLRLAGLCGVAVPAVAFACIFLAISQSPWFSWTANALSDLGVGGAAWVFNSGLMASGILAMVFAAGLWVAVRGRALARVGATLFFIDAFALFGIGLFPSAPGAVLQDVIHGFFSVTFFVLFPPSLSLLGASAVRAGSRKFGVLTMGAVVLSFFPWVFSWEGIAIPEALSALVVSVWAMVVGARLYLGQRKS